MSTQVSIIIPIYNTEKYLPLCINSILSQSFCDFEVLLVDDGSTDNSGRICDEFAEIDNRIRVFHKDNGGVSSARNLGLDNAQGEWLYFVDSDDEVLPGGIQTLVDSISDEIDIVLAGYKKVDESGVPVIPSPIFAPILLDKKESLITLYHKYSLYYAYNGYLWQRLFRSRTIKDHFIRFDTNLRIKEDTLFITQYICCSKGKTIFIFNPVYKYFMRNKCAMSGWRAGFDYKYLDSFDALIKMKKEIKNVYPLNRELYCITNEGIWIRYHLIIEKLKKEGIQDKALQKLLRHKVTKNIDYCFFLRLIRKKVQRILYISLKRIYHANRFVGI